MRNTVERFSSRVEAYTEYRPGYPREILDLLHSACGLTKNSVIADIGSGTGKLSELFLRNGNFVFCVEPNSVMRKAAEGLHRRSLQFKSIDGSAESTTLPANSVDFVTAGQAFHWFDPQKARREFARILKPDGWVVVIWNERRLDTTAFLQAYERLLLEHGTDYQEIRHDKFAAEISSFFADGKLTLKSFENRQEFDFDGLQGRIASTSYTPETGTKAFLGMIDVLRELFAAHAVGGRVVFEYDTRVYYGHVQ